MTIVDNFKKNARASERHNRATSSSRFWKILCESFQVRANYFFHDKKKAVGCLFWTLAERWWMKWTLCWHLINYSSKMKRAIALIRNKKRAALKEMRKNKNCLKLPPSPLVGPIYNIAFTEEVPFDCRNVTRFSHKHCCALFLPQTLWKIWKRFGFGF